MANCKFCGKPVAAAPVHHPKCWEQKAEELAQIFCNEYCHWPYVCANEDELNEQHCDNCALIKVLNLGS